jgi:PAT family beta-lactamase induction signal transducer AmpG
MWRYLLFFAWLYFIQGAALAYVINFQKPFLSGQGVSEQTLGLFTSLLLLPFILKVFIGILSDRVPWGHWGSRKPYMTVGLCLFAGSYFGLSQIPPRDHFLQFAVLTWLASLGLAMFDTCADGWAVDVADESEQSSIQAAMIAGKSLGLILMSFGFGVLAESHGYGIVFQILSVLSLTVLAVVLWIPYTPRSVSVEVVTVGHWSDLLKGFYLVFALFGVLYSISSFGTDGLLTLHLSRLGASAFQIGEFGMSRGVGSLLGAGAYALLSRRLGLVRAQFLALVLLGLGCLLPLSDWPWMLRGGLWGMAWGFQETAFVTLAMRYAEGPWAATFFAISMIFSNLGTSLGEALAAPNVPAYGFNGVFLAMAVLAWACLILVPPMMRPVRD